MACEGGRGWKPEGRATRPSELTSVASRGGSAACRSSATTSSIDSVPIAALLAADWSKSSSRRAVYVATTASPSVRRLASPGGWTLTSLLDAAEPWRRHGAVVAIDAPLGVPRACWSRARAAFRLPASATCLDLVDRLPASAFADGLTLGDAKVQGVTQGLSAVVSSPHRGRPDGAYGTQWL